MGVPAARAPGRRGGADDSGIEAAALGGAPGVRSARFAGEHATDQENLDKLLREVPPGGDPRLTYVCVLAYVPEPGADPLLFEGRCTGTITHDPRGHGGFGYDPAFVPDDRDDGLTMAELDPADKDAISHRGRAARAFRDGLRQREHAA
jgi:XTP/dITP diphosphohydrolase